MKINIDKLKLLFTQLGYMALTEGRSIFSLGLVMCIGLKEGHYQKRVFGWVMDSFIPVTYFNGLTRYSPLKNN